MRSLLIALIFNLSFIFNCFGDDPIHERSFERHFPPPRALPENPKRYSPCEITFISMMHGRLPATLSGNTRFNLWDELFTPDMMVDYVKSLVNIDRDRFLSELVALSSNDMIYNNNLAKLLTQLVRDNVVDPNDIRRLLTMPEHSSVYFNFSPSARRVSVQLATPPARLNRIRDFVESQNLNPELRLEYRNLLQQADAMNPEIINMINGGRLVLRNNNRDLEQLREYLDFVSSLPERKVGQAMQDIERIYVYNYLPTYPSDLFPPEYRRFLIQQTRLKEYKEYRMAEILRELKLGEETRLRSQIDELLRRRHNGEVIDEAELDRLMSEVDEVTLTTRLTQRAVQTAQGQTEIYRSLLNRCNAGGGAHLEAAKTKFKRFRLFASLSTSMASYTVRHWHERETDEYWIGKFGFEFFSAIAFTAISNSIQLSDQSPIKKYINNYAVFSMVDVSVNYVLYDRVLFGQDSLMRQYMKLYRPQMTDGEFDSEINRLKTSPTFEQDIVELVQYVRSRQGSQNLGHYLSNVFSSSASGIDPLKLTQSDLESEEGREAIVALLAERLYYQNAGNWQWLQTGDAGLDRLAFYRARALIWDWKIMAMNHALFQLICREPFGRLGTYSLATAIILFDQSFSNDLTYVLRQEAIGQ